jgi:hypothetical protein
MKHDVLKQATNALSQSGHEQQGGKYTRERLMASLHDRKRRSNTRFAVLLPMAAIFVGSTAFAAVTGRLETLMVSALDVVGFAPKTALRSPEAPRTTTGTPAGVRRAAAHAGTAPSAAPEPLVEEPSTSDPVPPLATSASEPPTTERVLAPPSKSRAAESVDDAHATYRRAHAAQFKGHDLPEALRGYEQYLAQQPSGRFAVDARYNRALCLVRLNRRAEARAELERFAAGSYGGYRQADAQRLLAALNPTP